MNNFPGETDSHGPIRLRSLVIKHAMQLKAPELVTAGIKQNYFRHSVRFEVLGKLFMNI